MAPDLSNAATGVGYAYKASLIGAAHRFELTDQGLCWRVAGKSGVWPYAGISAIRLSYRPVSMQSRRFRADITNVDGARIVLLSTTWQTAALVAAQDQDYRVFVRRLHACMAACGSHATLSGGFGPRIYTVAVILLALVAIAMAGLFVRAVATAEWAGVFFFLGFAALFKRQIGGLMHRNKPQTYTFDALPEALLP